MSYFGIKTFIKDGESALSNKNYWSALSVALALPSMCSRVEFKGNKDYLKKNGEYLDKKCYIDFCVKYLRSNYLECCLSSNFANVLYNIRCDIIHAGEANILVKGLNCYFVIGSSSTKLDDCILINIEDLCNEIFDSILSWCSIHSFNLSKTVVFNLDSSKDDRLLYTELCDRARKRYLLENFNKETKDGN